MAAVCDGGPTPEKRRSNEMDVEYRIIDGYYGSKVEHTRTLKYNALEYVRYS